MFKTFLLFFVLISTFIQAEIYFVDPVKSKLSFNVKQFQFDTVTGFFEAYTIVMDYDEQSQTASRLESKIDVNSIFTNNSIRDRKLRSQSFFDILVFPDILAIIDEPFSLNDRQVVGKFQIKNIEKKVPITFDFKQVNENDVDYIVVDASFVLNRHDFNISGYKFVVVKNVDVTVQLYFRKNNE